MGLGVRSDDLGGTVVTATSQTWHVLRSSQGCACDGRDERCPCIRTVSVGVEDLWGTDLARLPAGDLARALAALAARGEGGEGDEIVDLRPSCVACAGAGVVGGVCVGGAGDVWVEEERCEACAPDAEAEDSRVAA